MTSSSDIAPSCARSQFPAFSIQSVLIVKITASTGGGGRIAGALGSANPSPGDQGVAGSEPDVSLNWQVKGRKSGSVT
jgi:hypothetical protein